MIANVFKKSDMKILQGTDKCKIVAKSDYPIRQFGTRGPPGRTVPTIASTVAVAIHNISRRAIAEAAVSGRIPHLTIGACRSGHTPGHFESYVLLSCTWTRLEDTRQPK